MPGYTINPDGTIILDGLITPPDVGVGFEIWIYPFYKSGCLDNTVIHGVDSTELPSETNYPICTIEVKGKKVRIYSDPDCDCGKRRNKRDKSYYVIGYRLHTLTAINPSTGHSFPLVSIVGLQIILTACF